MREVNHRHGADLDHVHDDMILSKTEIDRLDDFLPEMADRHRYYQDLRGYVTDLVECFDEKVGS